MTALLWLVGAIVLLAFCAGVAVSWALDSIFGSSPYDIEDR